MSSQPLTTEVIVNKIIENIHNGKYKVQGRSSEWNIYKRGFFGSALYFKVDPRSIRFYDKKYPNGDTTYIISYQDSISEDVQKLIKRLRDVCSDSFIIPKDKVYSKLDKVLE